MENEHHSASLVNDLENDGSRLSVDEHSGRQIRQVDRAEMRSLQNMVIHGVYVLLYSFVKYLSFPLANWLRYFVLRLFRTPTQSTGIGDGVMIWFPWRVQVGKRCTLNQGVVVDGFGGVEIGDGVRIAAYVSINTSDHDFSNSAEMICQQGYQVAGVRIEDDVWIGSHVTICKGVRIGRGSVIGAGSVVTKDIPPMTIAVGVPCAPIRQRAA